MEVVEKSEALAEKVRERRKTFVESVACLQSSAGEASDKNGFR